MVLGTLWNAVLKQVGPSVGAALQWLQAVPQ